MGHKPKWIFIKHLVFSADASSKTLDSTTSLKESLNANRFFVDIVDGVEEYLFKVLVIEREETKTVDPFELVHVYKRVKFK